MKTRTAPAAAPRFGAATDSSPPLLPLIGLLVCLLALAGCSNSFDLRRSDESVVRVQHMFDYKGKQILGGHGTGFVLNDDGFVVTNYHVVDVSEKLLPGLKPLYLFVPDGTWEKRLKATVVWVSKAQDLAILRVPGLKRRPVTLARVSPRISPEKGENVYALGFPGAGDSTGRKAALESSFTKGNVSKVAQGQGRDGGASRQIIQHTANINPGNSGGPLFNDCNQVIGINTFAAKSVLKIEKNSSGNFVAHGAAITGVSYSPHIGALIKQLSAVPALRNIKYKWSSSVCVAKSGTPVEMYIAFVLIALLALTSMVLALVRKRGSREVVKVVETYSQWIRRKEGSNPGVKSNKPSGGKRRIAKPTIPSAELDDGWLLSGQDAAGKAVTLAIGKTELAHASAETDKGLIIGRSIALASKILEDTSVSRRHARIVAVDGGIGIEDLGSTYGTQVNGQPLEPYTVVPIPVGARVMIGDVAFQVGTK